MSILYICLFIYLLIWIYSLEKEVSKIRFHYKKTKLFAFDPIIQILDVMSIFYHQWRKRRHSLAHIQ